MEAYFYYMSDITKEDLLEKLNELKKVLNKLENKLERGKGFYSYENNMYIVIEDLIEEVEILIESI